ncbi:rhamnogalacturonan acetylesterase [uncultured Prevotella sp.]|uniref:rhamnogalacturonan acetylesterase n=1 Tax=uncultured Prevotella sp. TaxID=159272 RepID=UPI00258831DD|nr:rhamnogalacturonan acetylesterase [uncultured Prevotella sp.]
MKLRFIAAAAVAACTALCVQARKVHTIGDSTMATYDPNTTVTRGWGQMFQQFFKGDVTVNNRAKNGASSKSFYKESAYWQSVKKQIEPGDYVLIQFAHNDEKSNGCDGDELKAYYQSIGDEAKANASDYRGTTASGTYKDYLRKYVEETRALGATPVLVGAICRKYFDGSTIRRNGRHDLGDKFDKIEGGKLTTGNKVAADDHTYDYPYQMQEVAKELGVQYLDLTTATKELYESYGDAKANALLFDGNGSTHTSAMGATLIARLAAQLMQKAGILTENINLTSDLSVNPSTVDLGQAYKGQTVVREVSVNGFDLVPAEGNVSITASNGLKISADGSDYSSTATLAYKEGHLIGSFKTSYEFATAGDINESITVSCGDKTVTIPVVGKCVELADGVAASAYWRLEKDDNCTVEGPVDPIGETYSEMKLQKYSSPNAKTTWPEGTGFDATRKTQRNIIEGESWPAGEIDEVSTRWIEFAVKPAKGTTFNVNEISLYVCGCGGNGMHCKIYYSKEADFANAVNIADFSGSMKANDMMEVKATPVIELSEGETLRLRIYPWYGSAATGKTICLSDVKVAGVAVSATNGVKSVENSELKPEKVYYSLDGIRQNGIHDGLNIVVENGVARKIMK